MKRHLASLCAAISVLFAAGCAEIPYPDLYGVNASSTTVEVLTSKGAALSYIDRTRKNMVDQRELLAVTELSTDGMIAAGAIGGLMGGALHWAGSSIIRLATLSSTGVLLSDTFAPRSQLTILDKGIKAMDCVGRQAPRGFDEAAEVEAALGPVNAAQRKLALDLDRSRNASGEVVTAARMALIEAYAFDQKNQPGIYEQVRLVSNVIITATNTVMRKAVADPKAFEDEIKNLKIATTGSTPPTTPKVANDQLKTAEASADDQLLVYDMRLLQDALSGATAVIQAKQQASGSGDLFAACIPGAMSLTLCDSKPVTLKPGEQFDFCILGGPQKWHWKGTVPTKLSVISLSSSEYRVEAASGAAAGQSAIVFVSIDDASMLEVPVTVQPAAH